MSYEIYLGEDGIIRTRFEGEIGKEEMDAFMEEFSHYLEEATDESPLQILSLPTENQAKYSSYARKAFVRVNNDPRIGKAATVGINRYLRVLVSFVLKATGRDNVAFFDTEEEALAWLKEE